MPFQALLMVGHDVHAVCPNKKSGDKIKTAVHDFEVSVAPTTPVSLTFAIYIAAEGSKIRFAFATPDDVDHHVHLLYL